MKKKNQEKISFNKQKTRIIRDDGGRVEMICLDDICRITRMSSLIHNGKAQEKCPSAVRMLDRLFADIPDMCKLPLWIRKSTKLWAQTSHRNSKDQCTPSCTTL